jgi:hypothetical protein
MAAFLKTNRRKQGLIPLGVMAGIAAGALLFGIALLSHWFAILWQQRDRLGQDFICTYRGLTLASAMAVSGAAVNPNAGGGGEGITRHAVLSMLMGILNVRLGYWVLIIVCDGVADREYSFGDLANTVEKVRADFGALILFDSPDRGLPRTGFPNRVERIRK